MKSTVSIELKGKDDPFVQLPPLNGRGKVRAFIALLKVIITAGLATRIAFKPRVKYSTATATVIVSCASVTAASALTLNGQAITAVAGAAGNNQFSIDGTDIQDATALAAAINASTTNTINEHVVASNRRAVATCASVAVNDTIEIAGTTLRATSQTTDSGGNRITSCPIDVFGQGGNDTADGAALANCINAHPRLRELVIALNSGGVVTILERQPVADAGPIVIGTPTRLAVTGVDAGTNRMALSSLVLVQAVTPGAAGNAETVTVSGSGLSIIGGSRLAGGATSTLTF